MPASPTATPEHIKDVNTRYHDAAADEYDAKWGIDFGATGQRQVRLKLAKALGGLDGERFGDGLEIGSGTGYFSLNLVQLGIVERLTATDISPGMLERLEGTAAEIGVGVSTVATEAEELPFEDESFDIVFGHAVLHHIPDVERAFAEFRRVLRPGGAIAFAGEPSRYGDRLAEIPKRAGMLAAPAWRTAVGARPRERPRGRDIPRPRARGRGRRPRLRPGRPAPPAARLGLRAAPGLRRGAARQRLGLGPADARVHRRARIGLLELAEIRLQQLHRPAEGRLAPARAAPPRRALLQPARLRPPRRPDSPLAGSELSIRSIPSRTPARTSSRTRSFVARWASRFSAPSSAVAASAAASSSSPPTSRSRKPAFTASSGSSSAPVTVQRSK